MDSCSLEVICPRDSIPTPFPQSMLPFYIVRSNRYKKHWVSDITEEDLNNLPIILLGISDIKLFPIPTDNVPKKLSRNFPHIHFFQSKITCRKLATGKTTETSIDNGITPRPINIIWDYQKTRT